MQCLLVWLYVIRNHDFFFNSLFVDVVYVGTIHPHHHPVGMIFLTAKKNVLCEKPLAMNQREVKDLLAAAKENNVFLMEV